LLAKSGRSLNGFPRTEKFFKGATHSQKLFFLRVFYVGLDPAQIPTPQDLESPGVDTMARWLAHRDFHSPYAGF
jgi:hypothetical protein